MFRIARFLSLSTIFVSATVLASGGGGTTFAGVSLSVSKETAPPGALAQLKVFVTEPKPISTGSGSFTFDAYDSLLGIAVLSPAYDAAGVALVRGNNLSLAVISPTSTFGTTLDYPILTVAGRVPPATPIGTKFPLAIDPAALQLFDATGAVYPVDVKAGHLVAGNSVSIGDVTPGSATLPAGAVVTITGGNFVPGTKIKFSEAKLSEVRYINPNRIDVVLALPARMHGQMIKAGNPDGTSCTYFSYQRTRPASLSADPVMQYAVPLMPLAEVLTGAVRFSAAAPSMTYGIAVQNIEPFDATVSVDLLDDAGNTVATTQLAVPSNQFAVRELSELFGAAPAAAATIRVTSPTAVQVIGLAADQTAGTAVPILAQ